MGDGTAAIVGWNEALEKLVNLEALKEVVDEWERAQAVRAEVERTGESRAL